MRGGSRTSAKLLGTVAVEFKVDLFCRGAGEVAGDVGFDLCDSEDVGDT